MGRLHSCVLMLVATCVLAGAGCAQSESVVCANGRTCPSGTVCSDTGDRCLVQEQVDACVSAIDGQACRYQGIDGICIDEICVPAHCGDNIVTGTEECDGNDLGELSTCKDLGFYDATPLVCTAECRYDRAVCAPAGLCGDSVRNGPEVCDGSDLLKTDCTDLGFYDHGQLTCNAACNYNTSACHGTCGDGILNGPEICDGSDLQLTDCTQLGFYDHGQLTCNAACSYNTSACHGSCGDGILNGPEVCEEGLPQLDTCVNYGFDRGHLGCSKCLPSVTTCRTIDWRNLPIGVSTIISSIHGTSRNDVFAGGSGGALLHYDGTRWTKMTPAANDDFRAVWAFAPDHVVALGALGTIQRYNGTAWTQVMNDPTWKFNAVVGVGSVAYAVGNKGVLRYDGTSWTSFSAPSATELTDIWAVSATELYAINVSGTVSRYFGSSWQTVAGAPSGATAVWTTANGTLYVGAGDGLYQRIGSTWSKIGISFGAITAGALTNADDFCVVGPQSAVYCYDGTYWSHLAASSNGFGDMSAVWASASDDLFVAGTAGIQHHEGSSWFGFTLPSTPFQFWGDSTVLYAATASGTVIKQSNVSTFTTVLTPPANNALFGIWGSGPSDVIAVGQNGNIQRFNGSTWSKMTNSDTRTLLSAFGTATNNVYAVGASGAFLRYTTSWSAIPTGTTQNLWDVWPASATDVFVVGEGGTILRYNGSSFTTMASGTTKNLYGVFGFSATNVYAVGDLGTLLHWDGTAWTPVQTGTAALFNDVWGSSTSDVFAVGELGTMFHFDGVRWDPVKHPSDDILAIYGVRNEVYVSVPGTIGELLIRLAPW